MFGRMAALLLAGLAAPAHCWSRLNVGGKTPPITCGGAVLTEQIKKNMRGENPDVPVSIIARYPLLDPFVKYLSDFHVYCAFLLMFIVYLQFILPKGTVKSWAKFHVYLGRIVSFGLAPHYAFLGLLLNYYAIGLDVKDWKLAPPASDWRLQVSYIIPFALNTILAFATGFFLCKYSFMPQSMATPLKYLALFSMSFWFTIGVYQTGSQATGLGLGTFGLPVSTSVPGGTLDGQDFFQPVNLIVFFVGTMQAGQDYIFYRILCVVEKSGLKDISWKDMHKYGAPAPSKDAGLNHPSSQHTLPTFPHTAPPLLAPHSSRRLTPPYLTRRRYAMIDLCYQGGVILALFVAFFPFCLFGLPEWTCLDPRVALLRGARHHARHLARLLPRGVARQVYQGRLRSRRGDRRLLQAHAQVGRPLWHHQGGLGGMGSRAVLSARYAVPERPHVGIRPQPRRLAGGTGV